MVWWDGMYVWLFEVEGFRGGENVTYTVEPINKD